jgi:hypothetical protein
VEGLIRSVEGDNVLIHIAVSQEFTTLELAESE